MSIASVLEAMLSEARAIEHRPSHDLPRRPLSAGVSTGPAFKNTDAIAGALLDIKHRILRRNYSLAPAPWTANRPRLRPGAVFVDRRDYWCAYDRV